MNATERLSSWLYGKLVGIKPLENLDTPKCGVCGTPISEAGYHDYGQS